MPDLERVQQSTPLTLSKQWYEDGAAVDPGTVTLGITRADGTVLVAALTATSGSGASPRTFNLTTTHTALLDDLKVTWTSSLKGTLVSYVEVAGGFLFTIADARALAPLNNTTTYTTAKVVEMRTTVEEAIEAEYGCALVPRYSYETHTVTSTGACRLKKVPRSIRSLSFDGTAVTGDSLTAVKFDDQGFLSSYGSGYAGWVTITVGYEHGLDSPPARVKFGALRLLRTWLVAGPVDDRASTFSSADGGTYGLVVPGRNGSIFGLPELDAAISSSPYRVGVI